MARINGASDVFRAVADPTRRTILSSLRRGPKTVNEIARSFSVSRPAVSKHLRILRDSHLVTEQKKGRLHIYELNWKPLQTVDRWLRGFWQKRPSHIALLLLCVSLIGNSAAAATVEDLAWIAGCWSNREGESITQENWMKPAGGSMLGVGRTVTEGKTVFHEFLQ
ncbi:MAG TPA: metalloregulator ArsR/SmtB family transcription factor, partial [Acidobacteriota bacterium]|nr:metalloregulator ArsR/SmtB family transcription factor [Acidobacteriota bacterium]